VAQGSDCRHAEGINKEKSMVNKTMETQTGRATYGAREIEAGITEVEEVTSRGGCSTDVDSVSFKESERYLEGEKGGLQLTAKKETLLDLGATQILS